MQEVCSDRATDRAASLRRHYPDQVQGVHSQRAL